MKKLLVVLLALTALSVAAFAEDVVWTWGLTVKTGAAIAISDSAGAYKNASIIANDADDPTLSRIRLDVDAALGDFSAHARINSDYAGDLVLAATAATPVTSLYTNWWVNAYFLDKMIQTQFGVLDHAVTDTVYNGDGGLNGTGAQIVVTPISGLSVGVFLPVPVTYTPIDTEWAALKAGVSYTMENLFTAKATWMNAGGTNNNDAAFGVDIVAIPNLTADLEGKITDLSNSTTGEMKFTEAASYVLGGLKPSAEFTQTLYSASGVDPKLSFKGAVDYLVMTGLNVGLSAKYITNANGATAGTPAEFYVDPYAKFTFNDKAKLKVDAKYDIPDLSATSSWTLVTNINFMFSY